ncbi:MAG TPA: fused MFS/spermidine synthase [Rhizomicrobium sp.]|nr:fused MFS/spermidine synthase [Rhizomicrobium sp.]
MIRIEDRDSPFGVVTIFRRRLTGGLLYDQLGCAQSETDRDGVSLASYVHALYGLLLQSPARSVLMIGCGGGTLGTMLARAGFQVTIVDVNPDAFVLARQYFGLPEKVVCRIADGSDYLKQAVESFDVIVLDAYHGDRIPKQFLSHEFLCNVRARLAPNGAFFANLHVEDDNDRRADAMAQSMFAIWNDVRVLDSPSWFNRNAILMAGCVKSLAPPTLQVCPSVYSDQIVFELASMRFLP